MQTQKNQQAGEEFQETLDFMRNHQFHGSSKFSPYERDIAFLIGQGFTQAKVAFWLAAPPRNVVAARSELSRWINAAPKREKKAGLKALMQRQAGTGDLLETPAPTAQLPGSTAAPVTYRAVSLAPASRSPEPQSYQAPPMSPAPAADALASSIESDGTRFLPGSGPRRIQLENGEVLTEPPAITDPTDMIQLKAIADFSAAVKVATANKAPTPPESGYAARMAKRSQTT